MSESTTAQRGIISPNLYRRTFPLAVVSVLAIVLTAEYLAPPRSVLAPVRAEVSTWATIATSIITWYSILMATTYNIRRLVRRRDPVKRLIGSATLLSSMALFLIVGFTQPGAQRSSLFTSLIAVLVSFASAGVNVNGVTYYLEHSVSKFSKIMTLESLVFFITFLINTSLEMPILTAPFPIVYTVGDWVRVVPYTAVNRAALLAAGVGQVILALRAIIGKEPGLIEMEVK